MLRDGARLPGPSAIRWPKTGARVTSARTRWVRAHAPVRSAGAVPAAGIGLHPGGRQDACEAAEEAAEILVADGNEVTVWDVRVVRRRIPR